MQLFNEYTMTARRQRPLIHPVFIDSSKNRNMASVFDFLMK